MKPSRDRMRLVVIIIASVVGGAGLAAVGPLMTAFQIVGGRTVERTVSADREITWTATVDTLSRMEVRIQETEQSGEAWKLKGIGEGIELDAELTRVTPQMTKVSLHVEAGGLTADKQTAEEILNQIALSLEPPPAGAGDEPSDGRDALATAVTSLQGEILHLRAVIEEENKETRAASRPPLEQNGVAGVPPPPRRKAHGPVQAEAPPQPHPDVQEVLAAPLVPVEVLTPVQSLDGRQRVGE